MCVAVVLDADDGFRAGQPHIWISGLDPYTTFADLESKPQSRRSALIPTRKKPAPAASS
jgi:hypothetical protein